MAALAAYVVWHRQQRLKAAPDVRVLRLVAQAQFGIGDQCRSVMLALRVAITWNLYLEARGAVESEESGSRWARRAGVDLLSRHAARLLRRLTRGPPPQASFNPNLNFTRFMRPPAGGVDWTPRFNVNKQNSEKKVEADDLQPLAWKLLPLLRQRNSTKHIILSTDLSESAEHKLMFGPRRGPHDLVGVLFELTPLVAQLADASLGAMFGGAAPAAYVAVHLRLGGLLGEGGVGFRQAGLPAHCEHLSVFAAQTCARRLDKGLKQGPAGAFVLLSDNDIVRAVVRDGLLAGVVGPTSRAMHVSTAVSLQPWQAKNAITDAFVEIAHMARATCFVYANSGFSRLAAWLSNSTCMVSLNDCIGAFAKTVPGGKLKC